MERLLLCKMPPHRRPAFSVLPADPELTPPAWRLPSAKATRSNRVGCANSTPEHEIPALTCDFVLLGIVDRAYREAAVAKLLRWHGVCATTLSHAKGGQFASLAQPRSAF